MPEPITTTPLATKIGGWVFKYLSTKLLEEFKERWLRPFLKKREVEQAFSSAISNALAEFQGRYPELYRSLFDEVFVENHAVPELSKLLRRKGVPDADKISASYVAYFPQSKPVKIEEAITFFFTAVSENMKAESALQELINNRQIEGMFEVVGKIEPLFEQFDSFLHANGHSMSFYKPLPAILDEEAGNRILRALGAKSADLLAWPQLLNSGEWLDRPELSILLSNISNNDNSVSVVLGTPGSGKSALLARLGNELLEKGYDLAAIKADLLPRSIDSCEALAHWLHLPELLDQCLSRLAIDSRVVLLIDQLDALCDLIDLHTERLTVLLDTIANLSQKNVHLVLSCRDFEFRHDVRFRRLDAEPVNLALPTWEQVSEILSAHKLVTVGWPEAFREILRTPQYLKIFLEYLKERQQPIFSSYQAMLEEVWQTEIVGNDGKQRRAQLLQTLASKIADEEELWAPVAKYDAFKDEIAQLEATGILKRSPDKLRVGFSHQTVFDFTRARAFTIESGSFSDYVIKRQDALFVRPTLWSTLIYLRGADKTAYHTEFGRLWDTENLRIHIRFLMMEFLGQVVDPDEQEAFWLLPGLENQRTIRRILWVMQGNPGWFKLVKDSYLPEIMKADKEISWQATWFLSRAWLFAREDVLALVEQYWLPNIERDSFTFQVLDSLPSWDDRTCSFVETILRRTHVQCMAVSSLVSTVSVSSPQLAPRIVAIQLWAELERAKSQAYNNISKLPECEKELNPLVKSIERSNLLELPYRNILESSSWHELDAIAEAAPREFLESVFPWFVSFVEAIAYEEHPIVVRYRSDHSLATSDLQGREWRYEYPILAAIKTAIITVASEDHCWFFEFLKNWETNNLEAVHRLMIVGLRQLSQNYPNEVLTYLLGDKRRMAIGTYSDQHLDSKKLIVDLVPHLKGQQLAELETAIMNWSHYYDHPVDDDAAIRFRRQKWDREHRLRLLRAIPEANITHGTKRLMIEEERALGNVPDWDSRIESGFVGSPVSAAQMEKAKDEDIIGLFQELRDESGSDHPRFSLKGGSIQAAREFAEFAKAKPERALRLIQRFQAGIQERPVSDAIRALSESGSISHEQLFTLVLDLESKGFKADFYRQDMAYALSRSASEPYGLPDKICVLLKSWLSPYVKENITRIDNEALRNTSLDKNKEKEPTSILWNQFRLKIHPGGNSPIFNALTRGYLFRRPADYDAWLDLLESHVNSQEDPEVWKMLSDNFKWLRNANSKRAERFIQRVYDEYLINTEEGILLIAWVHHWLSPQIIKHWIESLKDSTWDKGPQAFGELVVLCSAVGPEVNKAWYKEQVESALASSSGIDDPVLTRIRLGCAFAASNLWNELNLIPVVAPIIARLVPHSTKPISSALLLLFNTNNPLPVNSHTRSILDAMIREPKILKEGTNHFLLERLNGLLPVEAERVYQLCLAILNQRKEENASKASGFSLYGDELIDIALTLQRIKTHRAKGLDLFEMLLEIDAYQIQSTLVELDRRPSASGFPIRPRRRRRKVKAEV